MALHKEDKIYCIGAAKQRKVFELFPGKVWKLSANSNFRVIFKDIVESTGDQIWRTVMNQQKSSTVLVTNAQTSQTL